MHRDSYIIGTCTPMLAVLPCSPYVEWGNVLKVGAIDCSSSENTDTCREFGVMGYPTVKVRQERFHFGRLTSPSVCALLCAGVALPCR